MMINQGGRECSKILLRRCGTDTRDATRDTLSYSYRILVYLYAHLNVLNPLFSTSGGAIAPRNTCQSLHVV
jgi:hypothetical protein